MGINLWREVCGRGRQSLGLTHREFSVAQYFALRVFDGGDKQRRNMPARTIRLTERDADKFREILCALGLSRAELYAVLLALTEKKVLEHRTHGQKYAPAEYVFLPLHDQAQCQENPDTEPASQCRETPGSVSGNSKSQCRETPDADSTQTPAQPGIAAQGNDKGATKERQRAADGLLHQLRRFRSSLSDDDFQTLTCNLEDAGKDPRRYIGRALSEQAKGDRAVWVNAVADLLNRYLDDYQPRTAYREVGAFEYPHERGTW